MLVLTTSLLIAAGTSEVELKKALEFQYSQKLASLQNENKKLKSELENLKKSKVSCPAPAKTDESLALHLSPTTNEYQALYKEGLALAQLEKWDEALLTFESFVHRYPESDLADNAIYWMAQIYLQKNEIGLARAELERLLKFYPKGDRAKRAQARLLSLPGGEVTSREN
jgi:TolA-binding protein